MGTWFIDENLFKKTIIQVFLVRLYSFSESTPIELQNKGSDGKRLCPYPTII